MVQHYPSWEQSLAEWRALLGAGTTELRASASDLSQLTTQLLQPSPVQERTLSRDALGHSRPRLHPHAAVVRRHGRADMKITVLNDNSFGICVSLPDHTAAEGVTVTVADLDAGGAAKTLLTDTSGHAIFAVKDFSPDSDGYMNVSIRVEKAGYRDVFVAKTSVKKGGVFSAFHLIADDGCTLCIFHHLNGKDAFAQELGCILQPANDASQDLSVQVSAAGDVYRRADLCFHRRKGGQRRLLFGR